jgi:colanic acid/amylovoran biosynthesis glycosyltransferase
MKINFIVNSFPTTSETFLFNLVCGLEQRGIDVLVCAHSKKNDIDLYKDKLSKWSSKIEYIQNKNIPIVIFKDFFEKRRRKNIRKFVSLYGVKKGFKKYIKWRFINQQEPDLIYFSFSGIGCSYIDVLKCENEIPFIFSCRGSAEKIKPLVDKKRKQILTELINLSSKIHCVSDDMKETLSEFGDVENKVFINYPSIEKSSFINKNDDNNSNEFRILSTGRLHYQKGYIYCLNAIKILVDKGYNIKYHICGSGPEEGLIKFMIKELGIVDHVIMHGRVSNDRVKELIYLSDAFLLGSIYEGIANAAIEAMISGLPVVSSSSGGMRELITNDFNGILVPLFSDVKLANGLEYLIQNPNKSKEFSINAKKTVLDRFTLENQLDVFIKNFKGLSNN